VARIAKGNVHTGILWEAVMERDHLEEVDVDVRIIFKWVFKKWHRLDCSGSVLREVASACDCGNEPSGSIKFGQFLD